MVKIANNLKYKLKVLSRLCVYPAEMTVGDIKVMFGIPRKVDVHSMLLGTAVDFPLAYEDGRWCYPSEEAKERAIEMLKIEYGKDCMEGI